MKKQNVCKLNIFSIALVIRVIPDGCQALCVLYKNEESGTLIPEKKLPGGTIIPDDVKQAWFSIYEDKRIPESVFQNVSDAICDATLDCPNMMLYPKTLKEKTDTRNFFNATVEEVRQIILSSVTERGILDQLEHRISVQVLKRALLKECGITVDPQQCIPCKHIAKGKYHTQKLFLVEDPAYDNSFVSTDPDIVGHDYMGIIDIAHQISSKHILPLYYFLEKAETRLRIQLAGSLTEYQKNALTKGLISIEQATDITYTRMKPSQ